MVLHELWRSDADGLGSITSGITSVPAEQCRRAGKRSITGGTTSAPAERCRPAGRRSATNGIISGQAGQWSPDASRSTANGIHSVAEERCSKARLCFVRNSQEWVLSYFRDPYLFNPAFDCDTIAAKGGRLL